MTPAFRRFVIPALTTFVMLTGLLGLGTWQIYRLHWKIAVLAQISAAEMAPAAPLSRNPAPYTKVSVNGRFRLDRAAQFGVEVRDTTAGPTLGFYQIVPLDREGATTILVNRGWVPDKRKAPLNDPAGEVTVTGYIRSGEAPSWFSATDNPAERQFFTLDPPRISAALGITSTETFILVAVGSTLNESYPAPAQHLPRPPNNHLSYVIIWYGLATALSVIFVIWTRKALRS